MWPLALGGGLATLLGGILGGSGQRPMLDPAMLRRLFGPDAISQDTQQFYRQLLNSPAFSSMMQSAAMQGTNLQNSMAQRLGRAGLGNAPMGAFLQAAGSGYGSTLQRKGQQELFMNALQAALSNNQSRMGAFVNSFLQQQGTPSTKQIFGGALANAGAGALSSVFSSLGAPTPNMDQTGGGGGVPTQWGMLLRKMQGGG